jgi:hypothetical protein
VRRRPPAVRLPLRWPAARWWVIAIRVDDAFCRLGSAARISPETWRAVTVGSEGKGGPALPGTSQLSERGGRGRARACRETVTTPIVTSIADWMLGQPAPPAAPMPSAPARWWATAAGSVPAIPPPWALAQRSRTAWRSSSPAAAPPADLTRRSRSPHRAPRGPARPVCHLRGSAPRALPPARRRAVTLTMRRT